MNPLPLPEPDKLVEAGAITDSWSRFLNTISEILSRCPVRLVAPISKTGQNDSIATAIICPNQLASGLYRLAYYARITKPGGVSSSLAVTLGWTDHGEAETFTGAAIVGNTVKDWQTDTLLVYIDAGTAITYSTTYASNAANEAEYQLFVMIEAAAL